MFDIGFWELALIGVVALIVIGPEKLPAVARTMGYWIGKGRRFVASVQEDLNREINKAEELKRLLEEQSKIKDMHEIIEHTVDETKKSISVGTQLGQSKSAPDKSGHETDEQAKLTASTAAQNATTDTTADTTTTSATTATNKTTTTASKPEQTADSVNEQAK